MAITSFTQLGVWQKAHQLRLAIFALADTFPVEQRFIPAEQMRRAAHSIPADIAEGFGRRYIPDKLRFYNKLKDSLIAARDMKHPFDFDGSWSALEEVCRMLKGFIRSTEERAGGNS